MAKDSEPIIALFPRKSSANGMIVHVIAAFKAGVHKCMAACLEGRWWDALQHTAWGFRQLPSQATGLSPFVL